MQNIRMIVFFPIKDILIIVFFPVQDILIIGFLPCPVYYHHCFLPCPRYSQRWFFFPVQDIISIGFLICLAFFSKSTSSLPPGFSKIHYIVKIINKHFLVADTSTDETASPKITEIGIKFCYSRNWKMINSHKVWCIPTWGSFPELSIFT